MPPPVVDARAAMICDAATGQIIWSRNPDARRPMASITKIMTCVLVLENGDLEDEITAPKDIEQVPSSSLHLAAGEKMKVRDLVYALMMRSANDAAVVLGRYIGGSDEGFAQMMNERAKQLGMANTSYKNPNGLHEKGHYSTVRDIAILARHAISLPGFLEIVGTREKWLERTSSPDKLLKSRSPFLNTYPGAEGIKSGYTRQAGYCYAGASTVNGWRLISVILGSDNASKSTANLMSWVHKRFERRVLLAKGDTFVTLDVKGGVPRQVEAHAANDLVAVVPKGTSAENPQPTLRRLIAPVKRGDPAGSVAAVVGGKQVARVALVVADDVRKSVVPAGGFVVLVTGIPLAYGLTRIGSRPQSRARQMAEKLMHRGKASQSSSDPVLHPATTVQEVRR